MKREHFPRTLQFFADPTPPADPAPAPAPTPAPAAEPAPPTDFDALLKSDKTFQSWLDSRVTAATNTAITNAQVKWQKAQDANLSEAEKLKTMTADEKAAYFEKKYQDEIASRQRMENASALERQTATMFKENGIPDELLSSIDFKNATADGIKKHVELLSGFEYHKKGDFDKAVQAAVNEKLKQDPPETHKGGEGAANLHDALAARYQKG